MKSKRREAWAAFLHYYFGSVYVPPELMENRETKVLHISDTPGIFTFSLKKMLKSIKPDIIIHTGDLVDDIKLEFLPAGLPRYRLGVQRLFRVLEESRVPKVYIVPGNHDDLETIFTYSAGFDIIAEEGVLNIEGIPFVVIHNGEKITYEGKYYLFGHNIKPPGGEREGKIFLNGIEGIHIILLPSEEIITLPYPMGTNDARLNKWRTNI